MRKSPLFVSIAALFLVANAPVIADLGWMSGNWVEEKGTEWTEEHWSKPKAHMMLGYSRAGIRGNAESFEFLRIEDDASPTLYASPQGDPAVPFQLVKYGPQMVVFENAKNDFPQRIRYAREGAFLVATISMMDGSKAVTWRYKRAK